jgi:hypothetical protein
MEGLFLVYSMQLQVLPDQSPTSAWKPPTAGLCRLLFFCGGLLVGAAICQD